MSFLARVCSVSRPSRVAQRTSLSCRVPRSTRASAIAFAPSRGMGDSWKDRERSAEAAYFQQQDKEALQKLLKKMDFRLSKEGVQDSKARLSEIFKKHGVALNDGLTNDLLDWKTGGHHEKH